jgi:hypothetical protein
MKIHNHEKSKIKILKIKNAITQMKTSVNLVEHLRTEHQGLKIKVEESEPSDKDKEEYKESMNGKCKTCRTKPMNMGIKEGEDMQARSRDNMYKEIIAENITNIEKKRLIQVQESYRIPNR